MILRQPLEENRKNGKLTKTDSMDSIKIQKYFSDCGFLSRRAAETEISAGNVFVNGLPAKIGDRIDPEIDEVIWKGKPVVKDPSNADFVYVLLNKPFGIVTTMRDEKGRQTVAELVSSIHERIYPVGRLDMYSDGALLLTNDGDLTNKLTHPSHDISKTYRLIVRGRLSDDDILAFKAPMVIDGYPLRPVQARLIRDDLVFGTESATSVEIILHEGRNRQIRKMCDLLGWKVLRLTRTAIGDISLGSLPVGRFRHLTDKEIRYLKAIP